MKRTTPTYLERNIDLIRKITWNFAKTTGLEFDDLFQEGCVAYLEARHKYNPNKGRKTTFTQHVVENHLKTIVSEEFSKNKTCQLMEAPDKEMTPAQGLEADEHWQEMITAFSPEARMICDMTLNGEEYLPIHQPRKTRGMLIKSLRKQGWKWGSIRGSFREIKLAISKS